MIFLSLTLPVHNEEDIIEKVVEEVIKALDKCKITYEIILVENGSKDRSLDKLIILSKKHKTIRYFISPQGYGSAILKGLRESKGKYVSFMPSDGQVDLSILQKLIDNAPVYDLVKVKRVSRENLGRTFVSLSFDLIIHILFGSVLLDINGDPKIFLREKLKLLKLKSNDSFINTELIIKISKLKWSVLEIPIENINRYGGKSTRHFGTYTEFFRNIFNYKFSPVLKKWNKTIEKEI
jgi:glycosyltransferase involved in cell wall biosynthesis